LRGIDIANIPLVSVVVAYFLPVSVLVAVTETPGRGICPAFTVPRIVPPSITVAVATGAEGAGCAAGAVAVPSCATATVDTATPNATNAINRFT
jgi:hypothetical protein